MQDANRSVHKLAIGLKDVTRERIAVLLDPGATQSSMPDLIPLADW